SESGTALAALQGLVINSVPAQGFSRVEFNGASVYACSYTAGAETCTAPTTPTTTLNTTLDRYSARLNVGATPSAVTVTCLQSEPSGARRTTPVLQNT